MRKSCAFVKAVATFLAALFRRTDRIDHFTQQGYPVLSGWKCSPEQALVERCRALKAVASRPSRMALFGLSGPHQGEVILLTQKGETLGTSVSATTVLTPAGTGSGTYQASYRSGPLAGSYGFSGNSLKVNGLEEQAADLYDFDTVELSGNRFLVLDCARAEVRQ